ncbi:hypothetical protein [Bacteroides sp.]|uniref:hypothetical protein n=1 Tax=Bacteroides sp. TaxID=29523 RepID=UPI0025B9BF33|nr:hypothetical protein [Bacteroides sp.]
MVTTPNTYIGTAVTSSATAPTAYTSYKWSQFKGSQGAQGTQGIAGTKGADGRTPYLHAQLEQRVPQEQKGQLDKLVRSVLSDPKGMPEPKERLGQQEQPVLQAPQVRKVQPAQKVTKEMLSHHLI